MNSIKTLTKKEYSSYLHSSIAAIFLGTFLLLTLFTFFWVDKFFERNLADLRPLFHWMPVLLIFLVSSLTMRSWSEEVSQGTLELLMTWPVKISHLVAGKFLGVMRLVAVSLLFTLPLVLTVAFLGDLDFGPVIGGYLGAMLVAAAYTSIGLWVSSLTENQIVALIGTVLLCGFFYLIGSEHVVTLFPYRLAEVLRSLGTGSRFESIARGVLDLRDLIYYASLALFFGLLNIYTLGSSRWNQGNQEKTGGWIERKPAHRLIQTGLILAFVNLLTLNLWLAPLPAFRLDLTARKEFSISPATKRLLSGLQEPLLIKFYSTQTHPLLDPLRPQVRDLIKEYEIVSKGKVKGVFVDPSQNEEAEKEANQLYNIKPVPFQVPGRNEVKIVNSYFNILVKYGDQHVVLNFDDLIELNVSDFNDIEVKLRNLEYDLTRSIKKVVYGFRGMEELFATLPEPLEAKILLTSKTLPKEIADAPATMSKVYEELAKKSAGKFSFSVVDLDAASPLYNREQLAKDYQIKPFAVSPFTRETFLMHTLLLSKNEKAEVIYPTGDFSETAIRSSMEGVLKRRAKGFIKTVGLWTPPSAEDGMPPQFRRRGGEDSYNLLQEVLQANYKVKPLDLKSGFVDREIDILILVKPQNLEDVERFAVDQFLMQGGTVLVASGAYSMAPGPDGGLSVQPLSGGVEELLSSYGIQVEKNLAMDEQNESFPVPIMRNVGGLQIQDMQMVKYPFFVDIRKSQMAKDHPALSGLPSLTLQWSSALQLNEEQVKAGKILPLLHSSEHSWVQTTSDIQPNFALYPELGFQKPSEWKISVLAATRKGPFHSFFHDKASPLTQKLLANEKKQKPLEESKEFDRVIKESTDSSRLVVVSSGDFISDRVLNISRSTGQDRYVNNLHFMQNLVDWSLEDTDLLSIRSRGSYARTLRPMPMLWKNIFEVSNYTLVLMLLLGLAGWTRMKRLRVKSILPQGSGANKVKLVEEKAA